MPRSIEPFALSHVLCPTDFSEAAVAALETALALAGRGAEIRLVHVFPRLVPSGGGLAYIAPPVGLDEKTRNELLQKLDRFGHDVVPDGVRLRTVVREGDPHEEIVLEAEDAAAGLIVMGRHSRGALDRWILGSVTEQVVRLAPCPVMVVEPGPHDRGTRPRHVLCAVDLGETAGAILAYAVAVANAMEADLLVLHVVPGPGVDPWAKNPFDVPEYHRNRVEDARRELASLVAGTSLASDGVRQRVVNGVSYREILDAAREDNIDLIVMGSHAGGLLHPFLGSTTRHVLRESERPVLVVPARVSMAREEPMTSSEVLQER
jgi:nucleotide-binding universal stress UspA family protein